MNYHFPGLYRSRPPNLPVNKKKRKFKINKLDTYARTMTLTSSIDSGNGLPRVSGSNKAKRPPTIDKTPKRMRGTGAEYSPINSTNGARIPPIRADIEAIPIPTFLKMERQKL
jgi:hypothetical protein